MPRCVLGVFLRDSAGVGEGAGLGGRGREEWAPGWAAGLPARSGGGGGCPGHAAPDAGTAARAPGTRVGCGASAGVAPEKSGWKRRRARVGGPGIAPHAHSRGSHLRAGRAAGGAEQVRRRSRDCGGRLAGGGSGSGPGGGAAAAGGPAGRGAQVPRPEGAPPQPGPGRGMATAGVAAG